MVRNIDLSKEAQRGNAEAAGLPFFACDSTAKAAAEHGDAGEDSGSDGILLVEEIEEAKKEIHPLKNSVLGDTNEPPPVEANWSVFEQMGRLGWLRSKWLCLRGRGPQNAHPFKRARGQGRAQQPGAAEEARE